MSGLAGTILLQGEPCGFTVAHPPHKRWNAPYLGDWLVLGCPGYGRHRGGPSSTPCHVCGDDELAHLAYNHDFVPPHTDPPKHRLTLLTYYPLPARFEPSFWFHYAAAVAPPAAAYNITGGSGA